MSDWTPTDRIIKTPYGPIRYGGPCRDDYPSIVHYDQGGGHVVFSLQRPAMKAWLEAQVAFARRIGWSHKRIENSQVKIDGKVYQEGAPISVLVGTNRTCATQTSLYRSDPNRYAPPQFTGHVRGLAVDINQDQPHLGEIYAVLGAHDWNRARSDEPWHWSFHVTI